MGSKPIKSIKAKKKYEAYNIIEEIETGQRKRVREASIAKNEEKKQPEGKETNKIKPKIIEKYD